MSAERTKRLLTLFYLFDTCQEVSWREIGDWTQVNPKGYQSLPARDVSAQFPESKAQRRYMERIIRIAHLIDMMQCSEDEDLIAFYREYYPNVSDRTRQRDFNLLRETGFIIYYTPAEYEDPGHWSYECLGIEGPYHQKNI